DLPQVDRQGDDSISHEPGAFALFGGIYGGKLGRRDEHLFVLAGFFVNKVFRAAFLFTLYGKALVDRNSMQPRRNLCIAAKTRDVPVGRNERFLSGIACVVFFAEHTETEREYLSLPAPHYGAESVRFLSGRKFDQFLVR